MVKKRGRWRRSVGNRSRKPGHATHEGSTPSPSARKSESPGRRTRHIPRVQTAVFVGSNPTRGTRRTWCSTAAREPSKLTVRVRISSSAPGSLTIRLPGRPTVGRVALNHEIEVRILAGRPTALTELWRRWSARRSEKPEELVRFQRVPPSFRGGAGVASARVS